MLQLGLKIVAGLAVAGAMKLVQNKVRNPEALGTLVLMAAASGVISMFVDREIDSYFPKH